MEASWRKIAETISKKTLCYFKHLYVLGLCFTEEAVTKPRRLMISDQTQ